jgi:hypothetical protein
MLGIAARLGPDGETLPYNAKADTNAEGKPKVTTLHGNNKKE